MASFGQFLPAASLAGLAKSYSRDLRSWVVGLTTRYAIAAALFVSAGAGLIAAIGVGLGALFHWFEIRHGAFAAYGLIGGILIALSLIGAVAGIILLKRPVPSPPSPRRRVKAAGRAAVTDMTTALSSAPKALAKRGRATDVMVGLAAVCFVGWLVASRRS